MQKQEKLNNEYNMLKKELKNLNFENEEERYFELLDRIDRMDDIRTEFELLYREHEKVCTEIFDAAIKGFLERTAS
jgi:hypothetical protein